MEKVAKKSLVYNVSRGLTAGMFVVSSSFFSGCATDYGLEGALGGAGIGAIIGHQRNQDKTLEGAAIGGIIGGLLGSQIEKQPPRYEQRRHWQIDRSRHGRGMYRWVPGHYESRTYRVR